MATWRNGFQRDSLFGPPGNTGRGSSIGCFAKSLGESSPNPIDEAIIFVAAALQIKAGGCKVVVANPRRHRLIILKHGGAVFVIVCVCSFEEDEPARRGGERCWIRVVLEEGENFAGGIEAIVVDLGEDFIDSRRLLGGLQLINFSAGLCVTAEERQEGGVLQEEKFASLIVAAMLPGIMQRIGEGGRMQGKNSRRAHHQLPGAFEKGIEKRLRTGTAIEQFNRFFARVAR